MTSSNKTDTDDTVGRKKMLHAECKTRPKAHYVIAARKAGNMKLEDWIIQTLDAAIDNLDLNLDD